MLLFVYQICLLLIIYILIKYKLYVSSVTILKQLSKL